MTSNETTNNLVSFIIAVSRTHFIEKDLFDG